MQSSVECLLGGACHNVVPREPTEDPWHVSWSLQEHRYSSFATPSSPNGPVTISPSGMEARKKALRLVSMDHQGRARWHPEGLPARADDRRAALDRVMTMPIPRAAENADRHHLLCGQANAAAPDPCKLAGHRAIDLICGRLNPGAGAFQAPHPAVESRIDGKGIGGPSDGRMSGGNPFDTDRHAADAFKLLQRALGCPGHKSAATRKQSKP